MWDSRSDPDEEPDPDSTPTEGDDSLTVPTDAGGVFDARGGDDSVRSGQTLAPTAPRRNRPF
ncbi:hypothetical protein MASR2M74_07910 [Paracoccaceae bacterium]